MNYIIRKRTKDGNFKTLKEMPNTSEAIAKSIASVLSCQKAHENDFVYLVDDDNNRSIVYQKGMRICEFKDDKLIYHRW